jgi:hypothetical protein
MTQIRQPKFLMGADVIIPVEMINENAEFKRQVSVTGQVCRVWYDPCDGTTGGPYYQYGVHVPGARNPVFVAEPSITPASAGNKQEEHNA